MKLLQDQHQLHYHAFYDSGLEARSGLNNNPAVTLHSVLGSFFLAG
jgi:hypothetical protein